MLIVPGAHLGLEGYIRVWLGGKPEFLREGLRRIGVELHAEIGRCLGIPTFTAASRYRLALHALRGLLGSTK